MWHDGASFEFQRTSVGAQVSVGLWDEPKGGWPAELLGKAVVRVDECRPGVPHTHVASLLAGTLVLRLSRDCDDVLMEDG